MKKVFFKNKYFPNQIDICLLVCTKNCSHAYLGTSKFIHYCDCGNETIAHAGNIQNGRTSSCGCLEGKSLGERLIKNILTENEVDFMQQKRFDDCKHVLALPFDFYLSHFCSVLVCLLVLCSYLFKSRLNFCFLHLYSPP